MATAITVVATLVVGGITRLTESGLSITEWKPVSGVLPPLTHDAWEAAYSAYLRIPEAQTVHRGITLDEFRTLFWWEWAHRIVARLAGLVIAVPYLVLLARKRMPRRLRLPLLSLPLLTAAQGALGWYMVASGLAGRTDVSPYRLTAHLGLALVILVISVWTALVLVSPVGSRRQLQAVTERGRPPGPAILGTSLALTGATILAGGFVAGLDAGRVFNTFPLMGGALVPPGYAQLAPLWRNWFENAAAAQFNHRVLAVLTVLASIALWWRARAAGAGAHQREVRRAGRAVAVAALSQFLLGLLTLLLAVPVTIATLHQLGAVALLVSQLWLTRESQVARGDSGGAP